MLSQTQYYIFSPVQTEREAHGIKVVLVFIQVIGFGDGKASVLQDLHLDFLRLLFGLLLQPLLLQNFFDGHLLQDCVTGFIHILYRETKDITFVRNSTYKSKQFQ